VTEAHSTTCPACGRVVHDGLHCSVCGAALPVVPPGRHMGVSASGEPTVDFGHESVVATTHLPAPTRPIEQTHQIEQTRPSDTDPIEEQKVRWGVVAAALLAGVVIGGLVAASRDPAPAGREIARIVLRPEGTTAAFDGGTLSAPPGAVSTRTPVVVRRAPSTEQLTIRPPGSRDERTYVAGRLQLYSFEPSDLRFRRPVTMTFRVRSDDPGAVFVLEGDRLLFVPGNADPQRGVIVVQTLDLAFAQAQPLTEVQR
jgi:hypothetical protein